MGRNILNSCLFNLISSKMNINVLDVITGVIMDKNDIRIVFPDDMLNGCMTLSANAELAFRRIVDLIYTNDDKLFDDVVIWELITRGFNQDIDRVKSELIKKRQNLHRERTN